MKPYLRVSRGVHLRLAILLGAALAACDSQQHFTFADRSEAGVDAVADGTDGEVPCLATSVACDGDRPYHCDGSGHRVYDAACGGATPTCVSGRGCLACRPDARRCDPDDGLVIQRCSPEGSAWQAETRCNVADGLACVDSACQNPCDAAAREQSYIGCEYWPVSTANTQPSVEAGTFGVVVANSETYPVTATVNGGALKSPVVRTIAPQSLEVITLPWVLRLALPGGTGRTVVARGGAYHLRTTAPVTVYQFSPFEDNASTDASLLLPTPVLRGHYIVLSYGEANHPLPGAFAAIVGVDDAPTDVTLTPRQPTSGGDVPPIAAGERRTVQLHRGDVLQVFPAAPDGNDTTGMVIEASRPVAVYGGNLCTQVPNGNYACDHLEEQMFPVETWGRHYAVPRLANSRAGLHTVRVLAQRDGTVVTFDPPAVHAPATLGAGEFLEFDTSLGVELTASAPALVAQYLYSTQTQTGNPSMMLVPPVEQYRASYLFLVPDFPLNWITVTSPPGAELVLDGARLDAPELATGSGYVARSVEIAPGVHRVDAVGAGVTFAVVVYGTEYATTYGYPGGADLRVINPPD